MCTSLSADEHGVLEHVVLIAGRDERADERTNLKRVLRRRLRLRARGECSQRDDDGECEARAKSCRPKRGWGRGHGVGGVARHLVDLLRR